VLNRLSEFGVMIAYRDKKVVGVFDVFVRPLQFHPGSTRLRTAALVACR
jgi:hypothetical protein